MDKGEINKEYFWGHNRRFNAYSNYFKAHFGGRVQKLSVDAGFTCPNRDGKVGRGGCSYCNNDAFSPSYCVPEKSVSKQLEEGITFHSRRYRRSIGYLAYFQAYTNTYSSPERLRVLYEEALKVPEVIGLVIGTRPDEVDNKKLDLLQELSESSYVTIEYGVESVYDRTLERINRGHNYQSSVRAIEETARRGINCGAHFIFGLPGESRDEMLAYSDRISALPLSSVKFHQLQIVEGTAMADEYKEDPSGFEFFTWDEYQDFFIGFLERLNPAIVVERFTGESSPKLILSPRWGKGRSDRLMLEFEQRMEELDTWQGRLYKGKGL